MGKLHSKHVCKREGPEGECILSNVHMNPAISSDGSASQLETTSITKKAFTDDLFNFNHLPLRVLLPPEKEEKKVNMESDTTDNNVHTDKSITVEEFECGVSVEGSSSDKQEWNFTLYDFDGRGKITKEDLAQLLQSLYDAVGSSINLPQTGTRTLKLKLSVSPDDAKVTNVGAAVAGLCKEDNTTVETTRLRKCQSKHNKDRENCRSRERHERSTSAKDSNDNGRANQVFKLKLRKSNLVGMCGAGTSYGPQLDIKNNLSIGPAHSRSPGKRLSSHEHKHLAELIQKNMERNQQRQQHKIKRHHSEQAPKTSYGNNQASTQNVENPDRRNYYLDLAGIENFESNKIHNMSAPPGLLDTSAHGHGSRQPHDRTFEYSKFRTPKTHRTYESKRQSRSRTHDVSPGVSGAQTAKIEAAAEQFAVQYENAVEEEYVVPPQDPSGAAGEPACGTAGAPAYASGTSPHIQPKSASNPKTHKFKPVSLPAHIPETVSPHHHRRHRHREKNHTRAMQQVAEWIDREVPSGSQHVVVQKHEHHHIHEHHHHHHYHHYHET